VTNQSQSADLLPRLRDIDEQFTKSSVPIRLRPLEAFKVLHGSIPDGERRNSLFAPIAAWFIERYGTRAQWDGVVARIPFLIRGNLYLLAVPFITADTALKLTDFIEGLPQDVADGLTPEEMGTSLETAMLCTSAVHRIYNLSVDDVHFSSEERELLRRALFDLENASTSLKSNEDAQGAVFNAHAAAEKFLKIGIKRAGISDDLISHKLPKIFEKLVGLRKAYSWLKSSVDALQNLAPDMNIRYQLVPRSPSEAVSAIYISLNICSMLAQVWLFDLARRSEKSSFVPGRFYVDGRRATFYCDRIHTTTSGNPGVVLMSFGGLTGSFISELVLEQEASSLYLEVTDARQSAELKTQFDEQRQRCQTPIDPKDVGMGIHSKPEGSYAGGMMRLRIDGEAK
jgi:HEPN domain-containing protein